MIYAVISGDTVINIIEADEEYAIEAENMVLVPLEDGYGIGDRYANGAFEKREINTGENIEDGQISDSEALAIMLGEVTE